VLGQESGNENCYILMLVEEVEGVGYVKMGASMDGDMA